MMTRDEECAGWLLDPAILYAITTDFAIVKRGLFIERSTNGFFYQKGK